MSKFFLNIYRFIFLRKIFYRFNYHLHRTSLRGIGVFNSEGPEVTGESHLLKVLNKKISLKTIFDVGANDGGFSREIRDYFPKATIYAFEPHPKTFLLLKKISKEVDIKVYNVALGSKLGNVTLWDFADDAKLKHTQPTSTLASVYEDVIREFHKQRAQGFKVKQITIDNFLKRGGGIKNIDFLKIDTEGSEYDVLRGAIETIRNNKINIIQFEFNEMNAYAKVFFKDFINLLSNYYFYRIMPRGLLQLEDYKPSTHEIFGFQNILAVLPKYKKIIDAI